MSSVSSIMRLRHSLLVWCVSIVCIGVPALALMGWWLGIEALKSFVPGGPTMNPVTALTSLIEGSSLLVFVKAADHATWRRIAMALSGLVVVIVSLRLLSATLSWSWSPDRLVWPERIAETLPPSQMSPNTAIGILCVSLSGVFYGLRSRRSVDVAQCLGLLTLTLGAATVIAFMSGNIDAAQIHGYRAMSLPSGFVVLSLGALSLLVPNDGGILKSFSGNSASAKMARRLLVSAAGIVILINVLRLWGEHVGLYGRPVSMLLFSTVVVAGLAFVIGYAMRLYSQEEGARAKAELEKRRQAEFLRQVVDAIPGYVFARDKDGRYVFANQAVLQAFGRPLEEVIGKTTFDLIDPSPAAERFLESDARVIETGEPDVFEVQTPTREGGMQHLFASKMRIDSPETGEPLVFGLVTDVTELAIAREEAKSANVAKSEFVSRMSHELRTPLNAVMGFTQLIEMQTTDEKMRESTQQILRAGKHLLDLINEVLDLSKVEAGRLTVSLEPVVVEEAVQMALGLVRPIAAARGVRIVTDESGCDSVAMMADRQRLSQILINLLSNSIKYNRREGTVTLKCGEDGERVYIEVTDTGKGIGDEDRHRLFSPFERIANGDTEGTGLGLSLSQKLAEAMHGSLELVASSDAGSTFRLELPKAEVVPETAAREALRANGGGIAGGQHGTRILYIEDNLANMRLIERVLDEWGPVEVLSAMQGSIGLDMARTQRPSLVLLDMHLPDMSGADVLREIRLDSRTADIPVIVLSADATSTQIKQSFALGADEYLTKPIDIVKLLQMLTQWQEAGWRRSRGPS